MPREELRRLREEQGKPQAHMAKLLGVTASHYAKIERGELNLSLERAATLARDLGVEVGDLL